mgnify:CR=1 FL=1
MKELESKDNLNKSQIVAENSINKQEVYLGSIRRFKGQKTFEMNLNTGEIKETVFEKAALDINNKRVQFKINQKPNYLYCNALNLKNAERKFKKMLNIK